MIERFLNAGLIENAINQALQLDPQAREKLAVLNGQQIAITLELIDRPWVFAIEDGRLYLSDTDAEDCDVRLSGTLGGFLHLFRQAQPRKTEDKLYIAGDLHSAQQFQRTMAELKPDFEAVLRQRFGDKVGHTVASVLQQIRTQGEQMRQQAEDRLRDYLQSEDSPFLSYRQYSEQRSKLEALEATLTALEARLQKLEQQRG